jgi:hypothetical protein
MSLTGHELVEAIFPLHRPKNEHVASALDMLRSEFEELGHLLVVQTSVTPEQTIAIRKLHEALQAAIAAVVLHQGRYPGDA